MGDRFETVTTITSLVDCCLDVSGRQARGRHHHHLSRHCLDPDDTVCDRPKAIIAFTSLVAVLISTWCVTGSRPSPPYFFSRCSLDLDSVGDRLKAVATLTSPVAVSISTRCVTGSRPSLPGMASIVAVLTPTRCVTGWRPSPPLPLSPLSRPQHGA